MRRRENAPKHYRTSAVEYPFVESIFGRGSDAHKYEPAIGASLVGLVDPVEHGLFGLWFGCNVEKSQLFPMLRKTRTRERFGNSSSKRDNRNCGKRLECGIIARFEAAHSLADWQRNANLQGQFWDQVSTQINNGNIADAQQTLRKLLQLAARQFRTWAVNAELHSPQTPKE